MKKAALFILTLTALTLSLSGAANAVALLFDNMSNYESGVSGANVTATASIPNTFMGDGYVLKTGATSITGFDLYPVNLSGTAYAGLKMTVYIWDLVNTGTVNATTPAFSALLGSYTFTQSGTFSSGFFFPFEGSPNGSDPGITLPTPLALSDPTIGLSFNYQGTIDGVIYTSANSLTSLISYGTLPTVGSQMFNGYFRNAASETDGNFTSTLRSLGQQNQSLAVRVYGDDGTSPVPEPATYALFCLGLAVFGYARRRMNKH
jgi:hypothetical protein